jgi:hypothetical protein
LQSLCVLEEVTISKDKSTISALDIFGKFSVAFRDSFDNKVEGHIQGLTLEAFVDNESKEKVETFVEPSKNPWCFTFDCGIKNFTMYSHYIVEVTYCGVFLGTAVDNAKLKSRKHKHHLGGLSFK